jgi:hypothetical protein
LLLSQEKGRRTSMNTLEIYVTYKNQELSIKGRVVRFGYVNQIIFDLAGVKICMAGRSSGSHPPNGYPAKAIGVK